MSIKIIVGSQMGSAEYVADQVHEALATKGIASEVFEQPDNSLLDQLETTWLICSSTHGAGELPDNIKDFIEDVKNTESLPGIQYAVIGLGDSSYDRYNQAAKDIFSLLQAKSAKPLSSPLEIDAQSDELPEDIALAWLPELIDKLTVS